MTDAIFTAGEPAGWPVRGTPLIIGVAGGSGSGKTTIAETVCAEIGAARAVLIQHDAYYRDQSAVSSEARAKVNYDHPASLETELLVAHLEELLAGRPVAKPVYDFAVHNRRTETETVHPKPVILVEGILVLAEPDLRALMDLKIYVDADADLRLMRRLQRDTEERGRSVASVLAQYRASVRPMHLQFVEPSKRHADLIIPEGYNLSAVATVISMIRDVLRSAKPS